MIDEKEGGHICLSSVQHVKTKYDWRRIVSMSGKTFIEFFAGIGLIHEALRDLGWEPILANDNAPKKVAAYRLNYPDVLISDQDIRKLDILMLPRPKLVTASFPCIDLSQAGNRIGIRGEQSGLVWIWLDLLRDLHRSNRRPDYLLIENVPGLLTDHMGQAADLLLHEIADLGYKFDLIQLDARHFLPQARNRVYIIAASPHSLPNQSPSFPASYIRRHNVERVYKRNPDLPWFFFDFPAPPHCGISLADIVEYLPDDAPEWWSNERMGYFWDLLERDHVSKLRALASTGKHHVLTAVRRLRRRRVREQIFNVRFDGLASCLRTPRGGSSTQFIVDVNREKIRVRKLLGIEASRLQGVNLPGSAGQFRLYGSETDILFGFGDAVCVPAVRWVLQHSIEAVDSHFRSNRSRQLRLFS